MLDTFGVSEPVRVLARLAKQRPLAPQTQGVVSSFSAPEANAVRLLDYESAACRAASGW